MNKKPSQVSFSICLFLLVLFLGFVDFIGTQTPIPKIHGEIFYASDQGAASNNQKNEVYSYACNQVISAEADLDGFTSIGNPAAKYCTSLGHSYTTITHQDGRQDGICTFSDNSTCDAWEFLQGKCGQTQNACAQQDMRTKIVSDGKNALTREYAVCVGESGDQVSSATDLIQLENYPVNGLVTDQPNQTENNFQDSKSLSGSEDLPEETNAVLESFDWRNYAGFDWVTPVKNQGSCGSCWAFSVVGAVEAVLNIDSNDPDLDLDLSEQYLVSSCHTYSGYQTCCGGSTNAAFNYIRDSGIPEEDCMPYIDETGCTCSDGSCDNNCTYHKGDSCSNTKCTNRCEDWASSLHDITTVGRVYPDRGDIQRALKKYGPLSVGFGYGSSYGGWWDGDIYRCSSESGANHGVVLVGYSDSGRYWIIKNSWGSTWNGDGFMKIGYGECLIEQYVYYADSCSSLETIENPAGAGTIAVDTSPNCGEDQYMPGTVIELTASPIDEFTHWIGDLTGINNPCLSGML